MRIPSRDLTDVTLVSEDFDDPDDMMKMKMMKVGDDDGERKLLSVNFTDVTLVSEDAF